MRRANETRGPCCAFSVILIPLHAFGANSRNGAARHAERPLSRDLRPLWPDRGKSRSNSRLTGEPMVMIVMSADPAIGVPKPIVPLGGNAGEGQEGRDARLICSITQAVYQMISGHAYVGRL